MLTEPTSGDFPLDLTNNLESKGRIGHGLCGKDADLDYGGQIRVISCYWHSEGDIIAELSVFATICEPSQRDNETDSNYESRLEEYADIIYFANEYGGNWTGDDWEFWLSDDMSPKPYIVKIGLDWDNSLSDKDNISLATDSIYAAIWEDPKIKAFQNNMMELSKAGE